MTCPSSPSAWNRVRGHAFLVACIASMVVASPAQAGLGDMLKKAKDSVKKSAPKPAAEASAPEGRVVYDDVVLELTDARIERILAAFEKARAVGAGRPALVAKLDKASAERNALWEEHGEAIMELQRKRSDVEVCYHDGYQAAQDRKMEEYREKALSDPALREKYMKAAQENNEAAAKGDSAAMKRIMQVFHEATAPSREDSLKVRQECGPLPPHSAPEDKVAALDKQIATLNQGIREIDEKVAKAQAEEGGLNRAQWAMALERIDMYLHWRSSQSSSSKSQSAKGGSGGSSNGSSSKSESSPGSKPAPSMFSEAEVEALEKHLEGLRAALG